MRTLSFQVILRILLITFSGNICYAQNEISEVPYNGANTFIVRTTIASKDSAYLVMGQRLIDSGYTIESSNKDFFQFKTAKQGIGNYIALQYWLNITYNNGDFIIRPTIDMGAGGMLNGRPWAYSKFGYKTTKYYVVENDIKTKLGSLGKFLYTRK